MWNAGIFIWSAQTVIDAFEKLQPQMYALFEKGINLYNTDKEEAFIEENYPKAKNISIDFAVLEDADNVYVLPSNFDWNDLGTWRSLYDKLPKNQDGNAVVNARLITDDAQNNIVRTQKEKLVVLKGLSDYIVVETDGVLLIYPKSEEQNVKQIVQENNL